MEVVPGDCHTADGAAQAPTEDARPALKMPRPQFSVDKRAVRGEDVVFVREAFAETEGGEEWSLYCICDGHGGAGTAAFVRAHLRKILGPLVPKTPLPRLGSEGFREFCRGARLAVTEAFAKVEEKLLAEDAEEPSGSSVTVALLCGRLLTMANVGDANAVLDTANDAFVATVSHRIESNQRERGRLMAAGVRLELAPPDGPQGPHEGKDKRAGPLRCFPGGLSVARSIGDFEAGEHIISQPHVFQVNLPSSGARLLMGSSGLWNMIQWAEAVEVIRGTPTTNAASKLIDKAIAQNHGDLHHDTSALVVDILPPKCNDFCKIVKARMKQELVSNSSLSLSLCNFGAILCTKLGKYSSLVADTTTDDAQIIANEDTWESFKAEEEARLALMSRNSSILSSISHRCADSWALSTAGSEWCADTKKPSEGWSYTSSTFERDSSVSHSSIVKLRSQEAPKGSTRGQPQVDRNSPQDILSTGGSEKGVPIDRFWSLEPPEKPIRQPSHLDRTSSQEIHTPKSSGGVPSDRQLSAEPCRGSAGWPLQMDRLSSQEIMSTGGSEGVGPSHVSCTPKVPKDAVGGSPQMGRKLPGGGSASRITADGRSSPATLKTLVGGPPQIDSCPSEELHRTGSARGPPQMDRSPFQDILSTGGSRGSPQIERLPSQDILSTGGSMGGVPIDRFWSPEPPTETVRGSPEPSKEAARGSTQIDKCTTEELRRPGSARGTRLDGLWSQELHKAGSARGSPPINKLPSQDILSTGGSLGGVPIYRFWSPEPWKESVGGAPKIDRYASDELRRPGSARGTRIDRMWSQELPNAAPARGASQMDRLPSQDTRAAGGSKGGVPIDRFWSPGLPKESGGAQPWIDKCPSEELHRAASARATRIDRLWSQESPRAGPERGLPQMQRSPSQGSVGTGVSMQRMPIDSEELQRVGHARATRIDRLWSQESPRAGPERGPPQMKRSASQGSVGTGRSREGLPIDRPCSPEQPKQSVRVPIKIDKFPSEELRIPVSARGPQIDRMWSQEMPKGGSTRRAPPIEMSRLPNRHAGARSDTSARSQRSESRFKPRGEVEDARREGSNPQRTHTPRDPSIPRPSPRPSASKNPSPTELHRGQLSARELGNRGLPCAPQTPRDKIAGDVSTKSVGHFNICIESKCPPQIAQIGQVESLSEWATNMVPPSPFANFSWYNDLCG